MGQPFPTQHPAVVLRSHFKLVRALLAVAMAAVLALSAAVVILAGDDDEISQPVAASKGVTMPNAAVHSHPLEQTTAPTAPGVRYDGGPEEGSRNIIVVPQAPPARYDGGPEEGSRSINSPSPAPAPERTTDNGASSATQGGPRMIPQGPGGN